MAATGPVLLAAAFVLAQALVRRFVVRPYLEGRGQARVVVAALLGLPLASLPILGVLIASAPWPFVPTLLISALLMGTTTVAGYAFLSRPTGFE